MTNQQIVVLATLAAAIVFPFVLKLVVEDKAGRRAWLRTLRALVADVAAAMNEHPHLDAVLKEGANEQAQAI